MLVGRAGFTVEPAGEGCEVVWIEDVTVRRVPSFLAPIAKAIGAGGFKLGMRKLAKQLDA